jgi:formamidase
MGDIHFSQGDGEITFCGAVERPGWIDIGVDLNRGRRHWARHRT